MNKDMQQYVEIGETTYMISVLPPTRAIKLLTKLSKVIGGPMAQLAKADDKDKIDMIPEAINSLMGNLDEEKTIGIIKEMLTCVFVENKTVTLDSKHFHGNLGALIKVCKKVLEVNYSDFLGEISALMD